MLARFWRHLAFIILHDEFLLVFLSFFFFAEGGYIFVLRTDLVHIILCVSFGRRAKAMPAIGLVCFGLGWFYFYLHLSFLCFLITFPSFFLVWEDLLFYSSVLSIPSIMMGGGARDIPRWWLPIRGLFFFKKTVLFCSELK